MSTSKHERWFYNFSRRQNWHNDNKYIITLAIDCPKYVHFRNELQVYASERKQSSINKESTGSKGELARSEWRIARFSSVRMESSQSTDESNYCPDVRHIMSWIKGWSGRALIFSWITFSITPPLRQSQVWPDLLSIFIAMRRIFIEATFMFLNPSPQPSCKFSITP